MKVDKEYRRRVNERLLASAIMLNSRRLITTITSHKNNDDKTLKKFLKMLKISAENFDQSTSKPTIS